jgi:hypothetical protein
MHIPLRRMLTAAIFAVILSAASISAATAQLASVDVVHIDTMTILRLTANGPIVWRESSGLPVTAPLASPLQLKIYGVTLPKTGTGASQEMTTELGKLRLDAEGTDDVLLTLTAADSRAYRVRSGRSANVLEILSE